MAAGIHDMERLRWQCRRGLLELDLILQRFLDQEYGSLSGREKEAFAKLLEEADNNLLAYLNQTRNCQDIELKQIINKII